MHDENVLIHENQYIDWESALIKAMLTYRQLYYLKLKRKPCNDFVTRMVSNLIYLSNFFSLFRYPWGVVAVNYADFCLCLEKVSSDDRRLSEKNCLLYIWIIYVDHVITRVRIALRIVIIHLYWKYQH